MKLSLYENIRKVGNHLAKKYKGLTGSHYLQSPQPLLKDRTVKLPPLVSGYNMEVPLEWIIKDCYAAYPMDKSYFLSMWDYTASLVKSGGWRPAKPFFEFVALMFPDLEQPTHTPRGVDFDTRGLLCQALIIAHYRVPNTKLHVSSDLVGLRINDKMRAAISEHAITWREGHYLCRTQGSTPIDFIPWTTKPMHGQRVLTAKAAALRLRLLHLMPEDANQVDTLFRCAAMAGVEACDLLCESYDIVITEDTLDQAAEIASLLAAQRQLKAKR